MSVHSESVLGDFTRYWYTCDMCKGVFNPFDTARFQLPFAVSEDPAIVHAAEVDLCRDCTAKLMKAIDNAFKDDKTGRREMSPTSIAPTNIAALISAVSTMRDAQRDYFMTRSKDVLENAKYHEKIVDDLLNKIETSGQPKQGEML